MMVFNFIVDANPFVRDLAEPNTATLLSVEAAVFFHGFRLYCLGCGGLKGICRLWLQHTRASNTSDLHCILDIGHCGISHLSLVR